MQTASTRIWTRVVVSICYTTNASIVINLNSHITMNQKFCNILVTWGTIRLFMIFLPKSWRWWTPLNCEKPSAPDTLWMLLTGFTRVVKVMNHTELWVAELAWYSLNVTHWIWRGREGNELPWTVRCQARLILSECYSLDLPGSWRWWITLNCERSILNVKFASLAWSTDSGSIVLHLPDFA